METIAAGVHQVSRGVNSFIVDGDEGVTLVDTGLPRRHSAVTDALASIGRELSDVAGIVLTHCHVDHTGGAAWLVRGSGASVYASEVDAPAVRGEAPVPPPPMFDRMPFVAPLLRLVPSSEPVNVDHIVGESLDTALPSDLSVIATPGHTGGHVSYLLDRHGGVLFVGDAAASKRGRVVRGFFNSPRPAIDASIRHIATHSFEVACFGHSAPIGAGASDAFGRFGT